MTWTEHVMWMEMLWANLRLNIDIDTVDWSNSPILNSTSLLSWYPQEHLLVLKLNMTKLEMITDALLKA